MLYHRKIAGKWTRTTPRNHTYSGKWQDFGYHANSDRAYYCDNWPKGLRDLGDADKVASIRHQGWFTDHYHESVMRGRVLQMPARNGKPRYIAGMYCTSWDGVTLYPNDIYDDAIDAARMADEHARVAAEQERDYQAQESAKLDTEELRETIVTLRAECRALIREIKAAGRRFTPSICGALREKIRDMRRESREAHERIKKLEDNYWLAVE